jgi:hypothetical protein
MMKAVWMENSTVAQMDQLMAGSKAEKKVHLLKMA